MYSLESPGTLLTDKDVLYMSRENNKTMEEYSLHGLGRHLARAWALAL